MLKPGSSQLRENEVKLMDEIKEFEREEDKTLKNMEESLIRQQQQKMQINNQSTRTSIVDDALTIDQLTTTSKLPLMETPKRIKTTKLIEEIENAGQSDVETDEETSTTKTTEDAMDKFEKELLGTIDTNDKVDLTKQNPVVIDQKETSTAPPNYPPSSNYPPNYNYPHNMEHLTYEPSPGWEAKPGPKWEEKMYGNSKQPESTYDTTVKLPAWIEKKYDANKLASKLGLDAKSGFSLEDLLKVKEFGKNGSKIVNWMIKNMPDGKQTIIVL